MKPNGCTWLLSYLVVMSLAVRQALPLVVPVAQERLLTLGAHEMLSTEKRQPEEARDEATILVLNELFASELQQ